jgi:hypothetical protein
MTAQYSEHLTYQGESVALFAEPLASYFLMGGYKPDFAAGNTALHRGYVGSWEIVGGRLYLVRLTGVLASAGADVNLETIFPGYPNRVFAHWYSGTLRVPRGDRLRYVHGGWLSVYERDEMLAFVRGVMQRTWVRDNTLRAGAAPAGDLPGSAAMGRRSP